MRKLERQELTWLALGLVACRAAARLRHAGRRGRRGRHDRARHADPPCRSGAQRTSAKPIGPHWVEWTMLDLTAIGGPTVLSLVVVMIAGFLVVQAALSDGRRGRLTSFGGMLATAVLKQMFARPAAVDRAASARGDLEQLSQRPCHAVSHRLPHARRDAHADRRGANGETVCPLHVRASCHCWWAAAASILACTIRRTSSAGGLSDFVWASCAG